MTRATLTRATLLRTLAGIGLIGAIGFGSAGCGGGSATAPTSGGSTAGSYKDLSFTLATDKSVYAVGDTVTINFTVKNNGTQTMTFSVPNPEADTRVTRSSDGTSIWQWSIGQVFPDVLIQRTLSPGDSKTFTFTWNQKNQVNTAVSTGTYKINAWYSTAPGLPSGSNVETVLGATPVQITIQ